MHRPQNLTAFEEAQADRLEDLSATLASLRRAVTRGDRIAIETYCHAFCRRLDRSPIDMDNVDELRALATHLASRVKFGVHEGCAISYPARLRPGIPTETASQ